MSKDSGLLSRMVKFVRNPRTEWSDLESADAARSDQEDEASKQHLREMLERKRQNDFVRKREFDALRKLRNKEIEAPQALHSPSFFPSSDLIDIPGGKKGTLEKIDAIEEQMSNQWFKGNAQKQGIGAALKEAVQTGRAALESMRHSSPMPIAGSDGVDPAAFAPTQTLGVPTSSVHVPLSAMPVEVATPSPAPADVAASTESQPPLLDGGFLSPLMGNATYESTQLEVAELVNDAELDEVAILYANGELGASEEGLLRLISRMGSRREQPELWMALFDLYRATGQHGRFDEVGIEFASVFGRSAPVWYSLPDQLQEQGGGSESVQVLSTSHWTANSSISMQNLGMLESLSQRGVPMPWRLDWRYAKRIDPGCGANLAQRLNAWSNDPQAKLHFLGADAFLAMLDEHAPVGDASASQELWSLRLAMLRILGRMDDFELHALNFCVTYEVSPPSWEPVRAECLEIQADGAVAASATQNTPLLAPATSLPVYSDSMQWRSDKDATTAVDEVAKAKLQGEVLGDSASKFADLNGVDDESAAIEVDCRHVQRVDFVAAGTLLNWVSDHQAKGQAIAFNNVNRLVAIFFRIIGIRELATVNVRKE